MPSTAAAKTWGGRREGAGRKPLGEAPQRAVTVTLPAELVERLRRLGDGNVSAGVRRLAAAYPD